MILLAGSGVSSLGSLMRAAGRPGLLEAAPSVLPATGQVRFKRKINVKRPHQPDWFRKQLLAVSKPQWEPPVPIEDEHLKCEYVEKAEEKVKWKDHIHQLEMSGASAINRLQTSSFQNNSTVDRSLLNNSALY